MKLTTLRTIHGVQEPGRSDDQSTHFTSANGYEIERNMAGDCVVMKKGWTKALVIVPGNIKFLHGEDDKPAEVKGKKA